MSFRPWGAINMMSSKSGENRTHSTVAFSFVDIVFLWEFIVTGNQLTGIKYLFLLHICRKKHGVKI